ncbi:MAG: CDP-alcohol phosphatidyltransferase [Sphingobacterium sp.]|jgi:CDP-diacylglycerol--glycerol-3-phosphate 3-phosphatidyltransferase|uniref:CDP-alcohol phosphatidyltransferase family protein n=1 Tax=Sphingobacterium sp. CZ-UAM TaxID=1933868 RepID=UPI0009853D8B|nr:CDP-alcohol phosphatidyltransferase family protein [Sphingobacterium sp. CZ-UAM]MDF2517744.1 CDP-alcohol phosphatidyltransferase [Sphingobacterium sp.]OOG16535.1 CDP-alcohol phosphatidyltransferase [Sphingobacterium sp. CZ-UAM]
MISVYKLKPKFQQLLMPVLSFLNRKKVTANQITVGSVLLSLVIAILFWYADRSIVLFLALPIGLLLRMALNALDGMMARLFNQTSKTGEVLNEVGDIVSDVLIFFPLLKFHPESLYLVVGFIVLSVINEFCGLIGKVIANDRRYDGPMGKSDRALLLGVYGILSLLHISITAFSGYIFAVLCSLLVLSSITRLRKALVLNE